MNFDIYWREKNVFVKDLLIEVFTEKQKGGITAQSRLFFINNCITAKVFDCFVYEVGDTAHYFKLFK